LEIDTALLEHRTLLEENEINAYDKVEGAHRQTDVEGWSSFELVIWFRMLQPTSPNAFL
jgi:hypothetical protein